MNSTENGHTPLAVFRVDASVAIGGGHVVRCAALADVFCEAGWRCAFAVRPETMEMMRILVRPEWELRRLQTDSEPEADELKRLWPRGCDLLVIDHYERSIEFETACRPWAQTVLAIDDLPARPHDCDVLLDQNPGRRASDYEALVPSGSKLLIGPAYALLRRQFRDCRENAIEHRAQRSGVKRILVSLGASDPGNITSTVLRGLTLAEFAGKVDVVLGREPSDQDDPLTSIGRFPLSVDIHVAVSDMAALVAGADLAIGAGGVSALERCCLGLGAVLVIVAENQRQLAEEIDRQGAGLLLGTAKDITPRTVADAVAGLLNDTDRRRAMSSSAAAICDGFGPVRVQEALSATGDRQNLH